MTDDAPTTFILAIPGTQETQELPREAVLEAIARGEILPDNWVWSPAHNDWKPVAEIPELQVAPEAAPEIAPEVLPETPPEVAPPVTPSFMNGAVPAAMSAHFPPAGKQPTEITRQATPQPQPQMAQAPRLTETQMLARTTYSQPMEVKHEFPIFKVLFTIAFLAMAGVVAANYFMVDKPFAETLASTPFASVPAYAHLGAFTQPGALVIHIPPNNGLNADNFADYLVALAKSTPPQPFHQAPFDGVGLTSSWQSQYLFNGTDWQKLAQMDNATIDEKKQFELEHLEQLNGYPLLVIRKREDPAAVTEIESKAWQSLVANFVPKAPNQ